MAHIGQVLHTASQQLTESPSAKLDAELLLRHLTGYSATELITRANDELSDEQYRQYQNLIERRRNGEPIAHILGQRDFWTLQLAVNPHTLIPRPDTELLVELALAHIDTETTKSVIDLGTGSGAIAIAIKKDCPQCEVTATDSSLDALLLAQQNARTNNVALTLTQSHWFDQLGAQCFDMVVSNPPYIAEEDPHLMQGDVRFEPISALISGKDGLDDIRHIVRWSPVHLNAGGWLLLEHGYHQAAQVRALMATQNFTDIETHQDLAGNDRVTVGKVASG